MPGSFLQRDLDAVFSVNEFAHQASWSCALGTFPLVVMLEGDTELVFEGVRAADLVASFKTPAEWQPRAGDRVVIADAEYRVNDVSKIDAGVLTRARLALVEQF